MKDTSEYHERTYENVMESLVAKEIKRQMKLLSTKVAQYVDPVDVATYSLNRLPPLYAASQRGREQQEKHAQTEYKEQIQTTVRLAIAAVQRDPLRISNPLVEVFDGDYLKAMKSLKELEDWLKKLGLLTVRQIDWENLLTTVKGAFYRASRRGFEGYLNSEEESQFRQSDNPNNSSFR